MLTSFENLLSVAFLLVKRVSIKGQLRKLTTVFDTTYVFKFIDSIIAEEHSLKARAGLQALDIVYQIPSQVKFRQWEQTCQILHVGYQVVCKIEHPQICQMVNVLNARNFIAVEVKDIKFGQTLQISDLLYVVLAKHQHSKSGNRVQVRNFLNLVVIQIQEN